ncbi:MAG: zinc ribbon domain-containing protein [Dehalococcoidia bacterium]|nr:zinc ribbon domain-containing protein [Dehalococcoidia bacterium]
MPIYEYECAKCHSHFERRQGFDEEPIGVCPECNGKASRVIQAVSVVYKGSGWYVTDYGRKSVVGDTASKPSDSPAGTNGAEKSAEKPKETSKEKSKEAVASVSKPDAAKTKAPSSATASEARGS